MMYFGVKIELPCRQRLFLFPQTQSVKSPVLPARSNYPAECRSGKIEGVRSRHGAMDIAGRFGKAQDLGVPTQ